MARPATTGVQNDVLATTLRILRDKALDSTFRAIPLLTAIEAAGNVEEEDGGSYIDHPVILVDHSTITEHVNGYESVNMAVKDPLRTATFAWHDSTAPVVLTRKEKLSNKGARKQLSIYEARLKQTMGMYQREMQKQITAGTSTKMTQLETLNGLDGSAAGDGGWLEAASFGLQGNDVGGLSKGDFTDGWQNQVQDCGGTFSLAKMQQLLIDCQTYSPEGEVDIILASPLSYGLYKAALQAQERYGSIAEQRDMAGRLGLLYDGAFMYIDPNLGFTGSAGANKMSMYFLNSQLFTLYFDKDAKFAVGPMESISGYAAEGAQIALRTQIAAAALSGLGILVNGET